MISTLFRSFFMGGIECSTHYLRSGKRLDLIAATRHDKFYRQDYRRLQSQGMNTLRSGIRWHLIEPAPGHYDFSSVLPQLRAAHDMGMQVIWDLCHYGYPSDIDIFKPEFVRRFVGLVRAFARLVADETDDVPFFCPINEISFFSWAGGEAAYLNPYVYQRGFELKVQLARASIAAMEAIWDVLPKARMVHVDPVINIVADPRRPEDAREAEARHVAQFQGWDLISGRMWTQIGGDPKYLDILGLNYYPNNQWIHDGPPLHRDEPLYRPFHQMVSHIHQLYQRPMFIAETGTEDEGRAAWLRYMMSEVVTLLNNGIRLEGLCLYPIICHPGWENERHCQNGLWDYVDSNGNREIYQPLADELMAQMKQIQLSV